MITMYGIRNCDTIKKARAWLDVRGVAYGFHDYKSGGIDRTRLVSWIDEVGWEPLVNRSGTTFRKLPDAEKSKLDGGRALALMLAHPSLIKRPVVTGAGPLLVGFQPDEWVRRFEPAGR